MAGGTPPRGTTPRGAAGGAVRRLGPNYGDAAFLEHIHRLTDLIPTGGLAWAAAFAAGGTLLGAVAALDWWVTLWAVGTLGGPLAAFSLDHGGGLARWLSSALLLLGAAVSTIVYLVRQHRVDDYQGRYRIWLWAALFAVAWSAGQTAALGEDFARVMTHVTGTALAADGAAWSLLPAAFLVMGLGTRLVADVWYCRSAVALLAAAGLALAAAAAARMGWFSVETYLSPTALASLAALGGHLGFLLAAGRYARYVILDAKGLLPRRTAGDQEAAPRTSLPTDCGDNDVLVHPPHRVPRPLGRSAGVGDEEEPEWGEDDAPEASAPASQPTERAAPTTTANAQTVGRTLTRAEKKALRKRLEKMRKQREGRS